MEQIYTAIQAAADQDAAGFRDAIHSAMADKISDALELKKVEIASSMFMNQEAEISIRMFGVIREPHLVSRNGMVIVLEDYTIMRDKQGKILDLSRHN